MNKKGVHDKQNAFDENVGRGEAKKPGMDLIKKWYAKKESENSGSSQRVLAERKNNAQYARKEEQEKKARLRLQFGGDSCMISVDAAEDINQYMRHIEENYKIPEDFLRHNSRVDGRMRQILVDWLIHVQQRFTLQTETLSLTVNLLDRSLHQMRNIDKQNLQLLGVTCLFCAAKFEEISVPSIEDFVHVAANVFTKENMFQMELEILRTVNFDLGVPHTIQFLRRYRFYLSPGNDIYQLAKYIAEVGLVVYDLAHHPPSTIAAVALWLAFFTFGRTLASEHVYKEVFILDQTFVISIARTFVDHVIQFADPDERLHALRRKYESTLAALTDKRICYLREFVDFGYSGASTSSNTTTGQA